MRSLGRLASIVVAALALAAPANAGTFDAGGAASLLGTGPVAAYSMDAGSGTTLADL